MPKSDDTIQFFRSPVEDFGGDSEYDFIFMNMVIEHTKVPEMVIQSCARLLKPSGKMYLSFPPFRAPFSHHLKVSNFRLPWIHLFLPRENLISAVDKLISSGRAEPGRDAFASLNRLTMGRLQNILTANGFSILQKRRAPELGKWGTAFAMSLRGVYSDQMSPESVSSLFRVIRVKAQV